MSLSKSKRLHPPAWRIVVAFLVVPGVASLLLAIIMPAYDGLESIYERVWRSAVVYGIFGAYPSAVIFGVPLFFVLRRHFDAKLVNCALAGAAVAAFPWFLLSVLSLPDSASIDGRATVIDGSLTVYGWYTNLKFVGQIGLFGGSAGALFWLIAVAGTKSQNNC
jgi:hypothetical protein